LRDIHEDSLRSDGRNVVAIRQNSGVMDVGLHYGWPCVWTFAEADAIGFEAREFRVLRTSERTPSFAGIYIGTVQKGDGTVRHVFEELAPPNGWQPAPPTLAERIVSRWPRFHVDDIPTVMKIIDEERARGSCSF